jgi:hypothetical protein
MKKLAKARRCAMLAVLGLTLLPLTGWFFVSSTIADEHAATSTAMSNQSWPPTSTKA